MDTVKLYNRDRFDCYLHRVNEDTWELQGEDIVFNYMSITTDTDNSIIAVDPPGGPYLGIGMTIDNVGVINSIKLTDGRVIIHVLNINN